MNEPVKVRYMLMMYRGDACVKIVEWTGFDALRLMRVVAKDLYAATRSWQYFLNSDAHVSLDETKETEFEHDSDLVRCGCQNPDAHKFDNPVDS